MGQYFKSCFIHFPINSDRLSDLHLKLSPQHGAVTTMFLPVGGKFTLMCSHSLDSSSKLQM